MRPRSRASVALAVLVLLKAALVFNSVRVVAVASERQPAQNFAIRRTPPIISTQPRLRQIVAWCGSNPSQP
jgi:hypothetical protein